VIREHVISTARAAVIILILGGLVPLAGCGSSDTSSGSGGDDSSGNSGESSSGNPSPREAVGDSVHSGLAVGDSEVRSVKVNGRMLNIVLSTPEGGFQGASTDDTDALASAALAKAYTDADWHGAGYVEFRGGLVDSTTGQDLPNAKTVSYRVARRDAKRINWGDEDALFNIDWSYYRLFCHPALKGC